MLPIRLLNLRCELENAIALSLPLVAIALQLLALKVTKEVARLVLKQVILVNSLLSYELSLYLF
jgi:hypothetical protein